MPVRTITTRLALDGETQFKQALTSVNASLRAIKSELVLSEAQFRGQANSVEALTVKDKLLRQEIEQQAVKVRALEQALKDAAQVYGEDSNQVSNYQAQLNRAKTELVNMNGALIENSKYLQEAKDSASGTASSIDKFGFATKDAGSAVNALASALRAAGVAMILKEIADTIHACVDASMDFETSMANFNKVAKLSDEELADMAEQIKTLSTEIPATTSEIAQVAEASSRLGVAKEHVLKFTRVMIDLGNVSALTAEEAATALARFANIMGTSADDYGRLGSVVVALGNNFATSESEITRMSSRLAAAGTQAGLTEAEIMALAAALSSVGIEAEAGGSAMTQTLTAIEKAVISGGEKLEGFAQVAGMSSTQFSEAWKSSPIEAIQAFIGGLAGLDEKGESTTLTLEKLGISGVEQSNMLKALSSAYPTLTSAIETANQAWDDNIELAATAAEKYDTTAAKTQMAANAANNLKIAIGDALHPVLGALAGAATPVIDVIETVIRDNPWLVQGITGVVAVLGLLTAGITAYNVVAPIAAGATGALATALHLLPFVGVAAAIGVAIAGLNTFIKWLTQTKEEAQDFTQAAEAMEGAASGASAAIGEMAHTAMEESGALAALSAASGDAGDMMEYLEGRAQELEEATLYLAGANDTLSAALEEQSAQGSLSLQTTMDLIDAGYSAALAVDEETGAVTLNRDMYIQLTRAKIDNQIAALETQRQAILSANQLYQEATAAQHAGSAYWEMAAAKAYAERADTTAIDAQISAMNRLRSSLGQVATQSTQASRSSIGASKQAKTEAEKDLEEYKALKAELDHEKAVDLVSEAEYYKTLAGYRDQYLKAGANVSEYRKVTEQIYKYDKALADQEAELWAEQTDVLVDELESRVKSVTDQQDKMESRLSGYGDLFELQDGGMTVNSIQEQIDAINAYEDALTRLNERGIAGDLMNEVLGMDVDSATQYANQLLAMSDKQWDQYNDLWDEKQRRAVEVAEKFFKDQLNAIETEYNDKLGDALNELTNTSFGAGADTGQGLIDGLASMEGALYEKARTVSQQVANILASAARIPSNFDLSASLDPSRFAERYQGVTNQQLQTAVAGGVNGMTTAMAGQSFDAPLNITIQTEDKTTIARAFVPSIRQASKENPEVVDDT